MKIDLKTPLFLSIMLLAISLQPASAFYNPQTGRWLNRDPIEERGGTTIFCFLSNDPLNHIDKDGRISVQLQSLTVNKCGGFAASFIYTLENYPSEDGYIVQEVTITETVAACNLAPKSIPDHFWEAWAVSAGTQAAPVSVTDPVGRNETFGANGNGTYSGSIRFFLKSLADVSTWTRDGNLLKSTSQPTWWNSTTTEPGGSRSITFDFKCCCPWLYTTVTTTPSK
jgi:hypothetical protein